MLTQYIDSVFINSCMTDIAKRSTKFTLYLKANTVLLVL